MSTAHTNRRKRSASRIAKHLGTTSATLLRVTTTYDRDTMVATPSTTSYSVTARTRPKMVKAEDGSMVESSDIQVVIPALSLDITPAVSDRVTVGGVTYRIDKVAGAGPGGTFVSFVLDVAQVVSE